LRATITKKTLRRDGSFSMKHYLFAKMFKQFSADALMDKCLELGLNGPTALIRDGYWVTAENMRTELPRFTDTARRHGCEVVYADTDIRMEDVPNELDTLKLFADCGLKQFRVRYLVKKEFPGTMRELADYSRRLAEKAVVTAEKAGIQVIIQNHGFMYPHNATSAYPIVKDLDPKYIGIKLDPGNNFAQEGYEEFWYQVPLLGEYIAALGEKDAAFNTVIEPDGKTHLERPFVSARVGCTNYAELFGELKKINFAGPGVLMPFYDENDYPKLEAEFREEIAYLKRLEQEAGL